MGGQSGKLSLNSKDESSSNTYTYKVSIKTGDRPKAGTDANVYIVLHSNGQASRETKLDVFFRNDFERGQLDSFNISKLPVRTVLKHRVNIKFTKINDIVISVKFK
jgi:hypothetical protein